jgi:RNA polymerase sigma factor (sigma-70 family)
MSDRDSEITATVRRERGRLGSFIRRRVGDASEAEDILQEVFEELTEVYRLPEPIEQLSAWLFQVARNRIIDRFRRRKHRPEAERAAAFDEDGGQVELELELPALDEGPEALYARSLVLEELQRALADLPDNQREAFVANELEGISFKEMAASSGVPINTLLARKRYAVLFLRSRLQGVYDDLDM